MRFLADECCDAGLVAALREDQHEVRFAVETMRAAPDTQILQRAWKEERLLLTEDKDFGELVYRLHRSTHGIILLRFSVAERSLKIPCLRRLLAQEAERLPDSFVVLEEDKIRIRPLR